MTERSNPCGVGRDGRGLGARWAWTAATLALVLGAASSVAAATGVCSATSRVAWKACRHEILDDYWVGAGVCANHADPEARGACADDNRRAWYEGRELCAEQFAAREELCDYLGQDAYDPVIDPDDFVDPLEVGADVAPNPYFPLVPGNRWVYRSNDGEVIEVEVLHDTVEIQGVECIVVRDLVSDEESGEAIEDTRDWYAQDLLGNVWYFGEIAQNFEDGVLVDVEGSWTAGVDGAKAGILMPIAPQVGDVVRQEWSLGNAEDVAEVVDTAASVVDPEPYCSGTCLQTRDFTPVEPGVFEFKYHAPGIGTVLIEEPDTGVRVWLEAFAAP